MVDQIKNFSVARTIFFFSDVHRESAEEVVKSLYEMDEDSNEDIYIIINSWGGSVSALFAILDAINSIKSDVNCMVLGEADSAAAVLASVGKTRYIGSNSKTMIHEVSSVAFGKISEMENDIVKAKEVQDKLVNILSDNTGKASATIHELWNGKDVWMNADESVEFGLIDNIIKEEDEEDVIENCVGKPLLSASINKLNREEIDFVYNMKRIFKNSKTEDVNNNKENTMPEKVITNESQLAEIMKTVNELTNSVNTLQEENAGLLSKSRKDKDEMNSTIVDLNSKLSQAQTTLELNAKQQKEDSFETLKNTLGEKLNAESAEKIETLLKDSKVDTNFVNSMIDIFDTVESKVPMNRLSDNILASTKAGSKSELDIMTPGKGQ